MRLSPVFLLLLAACSKEPPPNPDAASNKHMIWEVVMAYHAAGDRGDVSAMKALLHPDVMMYKGSQTFVRGVAAVEEELEARAERIKGEGRKTLVGDQKIELMGDVAVVSYIASVQSFQGAVSAVFRKNQGKWTIAHIHDSWIPPTSAVPPK